MYELVSLTVSPDGIMLDSAPVGFYLNWVTIAVAVAAYVGFRMYRSRKA